MMAFDPTKRAMAWGFAAVALVVAAWGGTLWASEAGEDQQKIAALVRDFEGVGGPRLEALQPVPIRRWEIPSPGVDVMRARLEETYSIDGIGEDTVELEGWIAVRHGAARAAAGHTDLNWNTAVLDTEFIAMELRGTSDLFGPIEIRLDTSRRPSRGQVGRIEIPELARVALRAQLRKHDEVVQLAQVGENEKKLRARQPTKSSPTFKVDATRTIRKDGARAVQPIQREVLAPEDLRVLDAAACSAPLDVAINMPDLGLEMLTKDQVFWYSLVDTIPPVGHTASITVEPVRLLDNGREVGTLVSGIVKFREVVRHVALEDEGDRLAKSGR